ncbi:amino acid permease-associated region [Fibrella aestuarina BUZ 2]|uniref:Amino acid permease-associated region n=1 Tax=Fibrella aestuarina BUZ 2 TaxID=1166018 RepID=I0K6B7_9BACT|nr:amino acid permease [Fibrella aestuarina]CCG99670.1 amino acid permease-associated region [Fibrella aestuarina BUZ 2]
METKMKQSVDTTSVWRRKPLAAYEADVQKSELKRVLTRWGLTSLGIGAVIGGGIFVLTGIAAHDWAGPALAVAFIMAGVACTFAALCYAEFASILPVEGSAYAYSYGTVGEIFAWFIGWNLILEYMMGATTVAVSWSGYFEKLLHLFHIDPPLWLMNDPVTAQEKAAALRAAGQAVPDFSFALNLPALLIVWLVTYILVKGIKEAASTNNIIVIVKVATVIFVIIAGAFYVDVANWTPFIPNPVVDESGQTHYGFDGIVTAAGIVFFAYIGFDAVSTQAGEAINPKKDVPFAIIASLVICTILYILVSLVLTGMVKYDQLDMKAPVAQAFSDVGLTWAVYLITIAAIGGLTSVMLVMMLGQTRIFLGMAKDGLLPKFFRDIHPTFRTPWKSTILVGGIVSIVAALTPIDKVSELCSSGTLLAFAMICAAVWILRVREPNLERPYRTPALPVVATLGILANLYLMYNLRFDTKVTFVVWGALGIIVYFLYSRRNSNLNKQL